MEVISCRERLLKYCEGVGLDVGFGCIAIRPEAICIDRDPKHPWRSMHEARLMMPTHIVGDAATLPWFADNQLDYVFSSHVLEDFVDTKAVTAEWLRVIKPGGYLVLFLPDQPTYANQCRDRGVEPNQSHKHADFGLAYMKRILASLGYGQDRIVHELWPVPNNPYSFDLVVKK